MTEGRRNALREQITGDNERDLALGDRVLCVPKEAEPGNKIVALVVAIKKTGAVLHCMHGGGRTWPQYDVSLRPFERRGPHGAYWEPLPSGIR